MPVHDQKKKYKRIVLKVSGESLMGSSGSTDSFDSEILNRVAEEIASIHALDVEILLVVGGGNFCRGKSLEKVGMNRVTADQIGMLATVMNGLALKECFSKHSLPSQVLSAININYICNQYSQRQAEECLANNTIVICTAGTGNPFFTTDTAASLRAIEIGADIVIKATKVDGIYSHDPVTSKDAKRFKSLSYDYIIENNLQVIDTTAVVMCRDHQMPLVVLNIFTQGEIKRVVLGEGGGTMVC